MPAYEPGGHQASDSLYDQATSATQVTRMGAKTSVKAVQGVAGAVGGTAAHISGYQDRGRKSEIW